MKRLILVAAGGLAVIAAIGCGRGVSNTANNSAPNANISNTNTATATTATEFNDAPSALAEGNRLFDINKTDESILAYKRAVELDPDLGEAWFKLGVAYALIEHEKELQAQNDQVEYSPTPTPSKKDKAVVRTKDSEKAFENAVKAYRKQISANGKDDVAYYNLGRAYDKLDEDEDSLKALKEAVKLKPDSTEYLTELGSVQIKLAQYDDAVKTLKKALEVDSENSQAEELLDKADAGRKRINFSMTPKPQSTGGSSNVKRAEDQGGDTLPKSTPPPAPKPTPAKLDKKGNG